MSFEHDVAFRRTVLCAHTQTDREVSPCVSGRGSHPCTVFGISLMQAIEQHMSLILRMKGLSNDLRSVTSLRQILVSAYVSAAVPIFELTTSNSVH